MNTPSRLLAALLSAAMLPSSGWSCPHRIDPNSVQAQTGTFIGNIRVERVSAKPAAGALKAGIVKIFVVAPGATVSRHDLTPDESKIHDGLRAEAAGYYRPATRSVSRGPSPGFSYTTADGTANVVVQQRTEKDWNAIKTALKLGESKDDSKYQSWVTEVHKAGHQLWSAEAVPTGASAAPGQTSDAFRVAVKIVYPGGADAALLALAKDKWLEALGNFGIPVIVMTNVKNDKLASAFIQTLGYASVKADVIIPETYAGPSAAVENGEVLFAVNDTRFRVNDGKLLFNSRLSADAVPQGGAYDPTTISRARKAQAAKDNERRN